MIVEKIMITNVTVLTPNNTIKSAIEQMQERRMSHIPIINESGSLVGLITEKHINGHTVLWTNLPGVI